MREILFRGKRLDNGEWIYGSLVVAEKHDHSGPEYVIIEYEELGDSADVDSDTVGQYVTTCGNGDKIFTGDILRDIAGDRYYVDFDTDECRYIKISMDGGTPIQTEFGQYDADLSEIISNIHDNPEEAEENARYYRKPSPVRPGGTRSRGDYLPLLQRKSIF